MQGVQGWGACTRPPPWFLHTARQDLRKVFGMIKDFWFPVHFQLWIQIAQLKVRTQYWCAVFWKHFDQGPSASKPSKFLEPSRCTEHMGHSTQLSLQMRLWWADHCVWMAGRCFQLESSVRYSPIWESRRNRSSHESSTFKPAKVFRPLRWA